MELRGALGLGGTIRLLHKRGDRVLSDVTFQNTITVAGIAEVAGLINGTRAGAFTYIAIGSSGTVATTANTTLAAEITTGGLARVAATCTRVNTDATNDTAQLFHTFTATATKTVKEVGIFDSAAVGAMLGRHTFTAKNMESADTLAITYKVDVD